MHKPDWDIEFYCGRPVIGKIVILPKDVLSQFRCQKKWACISITNPDIVDWDLHITDVNRIGFLRAGFDDIDHWNPGKQLITDEQGRAIADFAIEYWDQIDLMMIHCHAGMSRSTGIGKAISERYQPEFSHYFDQLYWPNPLVYSKVLGPLFDLY